MTDSSKLARDKTNKAIIVLDTESLKQYKMRKQVAATTTKRIKAIENKLSGLEEKIDLILNFIKPKE